MTFKELHESFTLEFRKAKRKPTLPVIAVIIGLNLGYLFAGMTRADARSLSQPWESVMFYLSLQNTLFLSVFMAVLASRTMDIEHRGGTWNLLQTMQSRHSLYLGKALYGLFWVAVFEALQWIAVIAAGKLYGFPGLPPGGDLFRAALSELAGGMAVYMLQCLLSLVFPGQFAALSVNLCGTLAGFFLMYVDDRIVTPWSVIAALRVFNMSYDEGAAAAAYERFRAPAYLWIIALLYLALALYAGLRLFTRMEEGTLSGTERGIRHTHTAHTSVPAELIKLRRSPVWIAFFAVPLISALIGTFNFTANQETLGFKWEELWTQQTLFLGIFFMPPLIGVFCGMLWRMEHAGTNWNLVLTAESPVKLVRDKMLTASGMSALCMLWVGVLYIICGKAIGLPGRIPAAFYSSILYGMLACAAISAAQSFLSLVIRSFALPAGLAFAGSMAGIACLMKGWNYALPYSMLQLGMRSINLENEFSVSGFIIAAAVFVALFYALSVLYLRRSDVKTRT